MPGLTRKKVSVGFAGIFVGYGIMEKLGQSSVHPLPEHPGTNIFWPGIEPGSPASHASTLAKSHLISFSMYY
jgi:hypothetical protein